jgi:group I intron endonuclease
MEERNYVVYLHINKINNKKYVGITKQNLNKRFKNGYGYNVYNDNIPQSAFSRAIKKYGWDNFEHKIIFTNLTLTEANWKEKEAIKFYRTFTGFEDCNGYNMTLGGDGQESRKCSEETKQKMRQNSSHYWKYHEYPKSGIEKLKQTKQLNPYQYTDEVKQKMKDVWHDTHHNFVTDQLHSPENIEKQKATKRQRYFDNPNWVNPHNQRVIYDGVEYESITALTKHLNVNRSYISMCRTGKIKNKKRFNIDLLSYIEDDKNDNK